MTTAKKVRVSSGKVLITSSSDWFTSETFYTAHSAGEEVDEAALRSGRLLSDGESAEVRESLRNDGPGEKRDHTFTDLRITNVKGKAKVEKLRSETK